MKKAICVGINEYPNPYNNLRGCVNDAIDWADLLVTFGFENELILNSNATNVYIKERLENAIVNSEEGDTIVFTYSGHGTQVADLDGEEADGYDEVLYVYDGYLLDDELRQILDKTPEGVTVYMIIDSCFSGTVTRFANSRYGKPRFISTGQLRTKVNKRFLQEEDMKELLLTGSNDKEYSYDAYIDGRYNGAMTRNAINTIDEDLSTTWEQFYSSLRAKLPSRQYPQTPQLEGKQELKERNLFKGKELPPVEPPVEPPVDEPIEGVLAYLLIGLAVIGGVLYLIFIRVG